MDGNVACAGENSNAYRSSVGKSEGMRFLGRPRHRWEANNDVGLSNMTRKPRVHSSD
jgi:hypothetical protein